MQRLTLILALLLVACVHAPPEPEPECFAPTGNYDRIVEHVAGDCSHMGYPRSMAPLGGVVIYSEAQPCGVRAHSSLVNSQLGAELWAAWNVHFEEDRIWEQWSMSLENDRGICVEVYVVTYEVRQ